MIFDIFALWCDGQNLLWPQLFGGFWVPLVLSPDLGSFLLWLHWVFWFYLRSFSDLTDLWFFSWMYPGLPRGIGYDPYIFFPVYVPEYVSVSTLTSSPGIRYFSWPSRPWCSLRCVFTGWVILSLFIGSSASVFLFPCCIYPPCFVLSPLTCILFTLGTVLSRSWLDFSSLLCFCTAPPQWLAVRQPCCWAWGCGSLLSPTLRFSCILCIC